MRWQLDRREAGELRHRNGTAHLQDNQEFPYEVGVAAEGVAEVGVNPLTADSMKDARVQRLVWQRNEVPFGAEEHARISALLRHKRRSAFWLTSVASVLFWLGHLLAKTIICLTCCFMALGLLCPRYASLFIKRLLERYNEQERRYFRDEWSTAAATAPAVRQPRQ